ncbi:peptidylprolyl isomerase [Altererythrobacter aurantiacus]|uniref:Parvulin-like PPIase n=1 Tax=Parapontixanthobacter aurantiacus TaxID=1463599 RepID=A0A844ZB41_9SPHN|nr:peptidylprolyl isomerase [Parapontixanthobacter aurantiacus]MXO85751.1 peptidylprolyl isomerase [Parapontixanthobacter aurantiacus]
MTLATGQSLAQAVAPVAEATTQTNTEAPEATMPEAASPAAQAADPLGLGGEVRLLGNSDPNVRTATAIVNGQVITGTDIDQRVALVTASSEGEIQPDEMERLRQQVLRNLIDETLQIQAAEVQELPVSDEEVEASYQRLAQQNFGESPESMDTYLRLIGSSPASLKRQIKGEMAWSRLVQRNVSPFVNVSAEEVNEQLQRLESSRGTEEYRLGEIYLSATPQNREAVLQNAQRIIEQLRQGGSFVAYARQFSEASTAVVGGDLGFVRLAQLPQEIASVAATLQPGQLNGPIEIPGGYSIVYLIDKRQVLTADPRDAVLSLKQISISFAPGESQASAEERVRRFSEGVKEIRGCGDAERAAAELGASIVNNDQINARALPETLQSILLDLQIGQVTPPFGTVEDGVRVLMLCGRDDPVAAEGPDFEAVMSQLENERIGKRAQRYLRDLRNDAYVEYN